MSNISRQILYLLKLVDFR